MNDTESNSAIGPIALIGGTGDLGRGVLAEFDRRGIDVWAIVRRPDAIEPTRHVRPVLGDVDDAQSIAAALAGSSTVVSAYNPGWQVPDLYERFLSGARSIQDTTRAVGAQRLFVVGGALSLLDDDGRPMLEQVDVPEPYLAGVRATAAYLEELRKEDDLDWVFLSPPLECGGPVGPSGRTGRYRIGHDHPVRDAGGRSTISREDLGVAVVDEVLTPAFHRERFTVGY